VSLFECGYSSGTTANRRGQDFEGRVRQLYRDLIPGVYLYKHWPCRNRWGGRKILDLLAVHGVIRIFNSCKFQSRPSSRDAAYHGEIDLLSYIVKQNGPALGVFVHEFNDSVSIEDELIAHCGEEGILYASIEDLPRMLRKELGLDG
jgi:hypothetical protein